MKEIYRQNKSRQKGAVSLFVVIFTALLLTTITVSFIQLMVRDQKQASNADLSESAFDSANAGVEDAKRALIELAKCTAAGEECANLKSAVTSDGTAPCTALGTALGVLEGGEVKLKAKADDNNVLDQAYTCVKITTDTDSYLGTLNPNAGPTMIPLKGTDKFSSVTISWRQKKAGEVIELPTLSPSEDSSGEMLQTMSERKNTYPALMRAQLIDARIDSSDPNSKFNLSDFDKTGYSNTLFLYPVRSGGLTTSVNFDSDARDKVKDNTLQKINCSDPAVVESGKYVCSITMNLGREVPKGSVTTFLSLGAFYSATDYKIELNGGAIKFDGVQPEVDSTGRANDLFRRVVSRIELGGTFNYPAAALETSGNLCKNFQVTTDENDYFSNCTP